jgi:hypothetical protein
MSFICKHSGKVIGPGVPEHHVVIETRNKRYENPPYRNGKPTNGEPKLTYGIEIVKEIKVSPEAYQELTGLEPRRVQEKVVPVKTLNSRPARSKPRREWTNPGDKKKPRQGKKNVRREPTQPRNKPVVEVVNPVKKQ